MAYDIETKICSKNGWHTPDEARRYYGRYSRDGVTIHWWGDGSGADNHDNIVNYFLKQAEHGIKSVNYVVSDNKITKMVEPDNVAWASNRGNPSTVSIEFQPTLSDEGYKRGGWLIAHLEGKYGKRLNFYPHSHWNPTSCPGTIDLNRLRVEADKAVSGPDIVLAAATQPVATPTQSTASAQRIFLPSAAAKWRIYPLDKPPVIGNEMAFLEPALFPPGLSYDILDRPQPNVVTIQTRDFGKGNIWVGPDTSAQFIGAPTATQQAPATHSGGQNLYLPPLTNRWRVYPLNKPPVIGNESGYLNPQMFGGLTYQILANPQTDIFTIETRDYGRVNIYAGGDTSAQIK